jgi:monooxygenase
MEHFDVIIVGAGLSGVGAACHLKRRCPGKRYAILEARAGMGGTWDLFRYPGIRSDSDMFTLGYNFKPWRGEKSITDGASIRHYVEETARENGVDRHIRFGHAVKALDWSGEDQCWTVTAEQGGAPVTLTANWVIMGSGYYRYDQGYTPDFAGLSDFGGTIVHPQHWPETLDHAGKRVIVIGSGATAMTLVPAMAETAARVTLLQRSPTYVADVPAKDRIANGLRKMLPARFAYRLVRAKNIVLGMVRFNLIRKYPNGSKDKLVGLVRDALGPDYDVDTHFTPRYNPWDQRLCAVPDADLFDAIKAGKVEMVTDTVDRFTPGGIALASGRSLDADIIVTATGLNMQMLGGARLSVDGVAVEPAKTMMYKGMMIGGVPNLSYMVGYNNASWTLKADLSAAHTCRILNHMDRRGLTQAMPVLDPSQMTDENFFGLQAGYIARALATVPRQGAAHPWRVHHNYARDYAALTFGKVDDGVLAFSGQRAQAKAA